MRFAWLLNEDDRSDLSRRIKAEDYPGGMGSCPCCGMMVVSREVGGVWQWVHFVECKDHGATK